MVRIYLPMTALLILSVSFAAAAEEPPEKGGVGGTAVGQAAEQVVRHGERPRVRTSFLPRWLGKHNVRKQIASRANAVIKATKEASEKYALKWVSPALTAAEGGAEAFGRLWEGDYRGAGTSLVNSGARELAAGVGAAGGAGAIYMLGAAGFSVGGPIGGAVGGAVGAVALVIGYDLYLSEKVKGAAEAIWGEERDPEYYLDLARANRQEFRAKEREAMANFYKSIGEVPFTVDQLRILKDEQTERLERRAQELAESRLGPRNPNAKPDPNEAKPTIPEDCTIEVAVGDAPSGKVYVATYEVLGTVVKSQRPPLIIPEKRGKGYWDAEERYVYSFEGALQGNVISGTWVGKTATEGKRYSDHLPGSPLHQHAKGTVKTTEKIRIVLFVDGTATWESETETEVQLRALFGVFDADTGQTEEFRTTPWPKQTGSAVWQVRKRENANGDLPRP